MATTKIAITLEEETLRRIDDLVQQRTFPNRNRAIQQAVQEKLEKINRHRLARECAKLDPASEKTLAEEGVSAERPEFTATPRPS